MINRIACNGIDGVGVFFHPDNSTDDNCLKLPCRNRSTIELFARVAVPPTKFRPGRSMPIAIFSLKLILYAYFTANLNHKVFATLSLEQLPNDISSLSFGNGAGIQHDTRICFYNALILQTYFLRSHIRKDGCTSGVSFSFFFTKPKPQALTRGATVISNAPCVCCETRTASTYICIKKSSTTTSSFLLILEMMD